MLYEVRQVATSNPNITGIFSRIFWESPSFTMKLKGSSYYKDFHVYLGELKLASTILIIQGHFSHFELIFHNAWFYANKYNFQSDRWIRLKFYWKF
jgi:hypothetical protein